MPHIQHLCWLCEVWHDVGNEDEHEKAEDGVELREHSEYHGGTECFVAASDGTDTIGTYLCLTNCRYEGNEAKSKSSSEDGCCLRHVEC